MLKSSLILKSRGMVVDRGLFCLPRGYWAMSGDMWLSYLGGGVLLAYPEVSSVAQHPLLLRTVYHNTYLPHRVSSVKAEKP